MASELKPCPYWLEELRKILRADMENMQNLRILTCVEEFYRAATRPAPAEDEVTIPRNPTEAMMDAGLYHCSHDMEWSDLFTAWQAMFDAVTLDGGMTEHAKASPAPAATDTGLVTVAYVWKTKDAPWRYDEPFLRSADQWRASDTYYDHADLCLRLKAEELLKAITKERDHWKEYSSGQGKLIESGVFVTNDEYVRLTALEAKLTERHDLVLYNEACEYNYEDGYPYAYMVPHPNGQYVARSQAEELLAAEEARVKALEADLKTFQDGTTDLVNEKIDAEFKSVDLEAKLAAANGKIEALAEYIAARDDYELATKSNGSFGTTRHLKPNHPIAVRYRKARAVLGGKL